MGYDVLQQVTNLCPRLISDYFFTVFDKFTVTPEEVYILSTMQ